MRHKFRWGVFLTILLLALISSTLVAQAEQTTEIAVGTAEGTAKETVSVTVSLDGNAGLCALHLTLSYDSDALTLKSVSEKGLFGRWYESDEQLSAVPYQMLWISADSVDATGELVVFTFEIAEDAELGVYPIDLTVTEALDGNGNNVTVPVQDGSVTVRCAHSFGDWSKTDDLQHSRECVHCGESESAEHNWYQKAVHANGACDEQATADYACRNCEITKTEAYPASGAHIYSAWEDRNDGTHIRSCRVCGKEESGEHTWNDGVVYAKEPCDETGIVRYTCTECNVTREEDYVPTGEHQWQNCISAGSALHVYQCAVCAKVKEALHEWDEGTLNTTKPCDENAKITYRCSCCNETKIEGSTPTAPHSYGAWEKKDGALHVHTCSECGKVESQEHVWEMSGLHIKDMCDENGTVEYECESCGAEKTEAYIPAKEHVYGDWQQNDVLLHKRACRYCGKAQIVEHRWDDGTVDGLGACDENGELVYACVDCGAMRREDFLPTASHIYGDYTKVDGTLHQRVCTVCEKIDTKSHTWRTEAEHILGPCDEAGTVDYACSSCNAKKTAAYVPAENHTFEEWMQHDATLHKRVCQVCSKVETNEHRWNSGTVERLGYCDENGRIVYTCIDCGTIRTEQFSPTDPHTYGDYYQKDDFFHEHTCMICQKTEAWEHSWNVIEESCLGACDENATITRSCSGCGVVKVEKILPTATHQYGAYNKVDDYFHQHICTVCQKTEVREHAWSVSEEHILGPCDENGRIVYTCIDCGTIRTEQFSPTDPHTYGDYYQKDDFFHEHTCMICQKTEAWEHSWNVIGESCLGACDENATVTRNCSVCGVVKVEKMVPTATHQYGECNQIDDYFHQRICTVCQNAEILGHVWSVVEENTRGACDEEGSITRSCSGCGVVKVEKILPTATHQYGAYNKVDDYFHQHTCTVCQKTEVREHAWSVSEEHILGPCDENGTVDMQCADCNATYTKAYMPTDTHAFEAWNAVDAATHQRICTGCGKLETSVHTWDKGTIHIEICGSVGTIEYVCTSCGYTYSEEYTSNAEHVYAYQKKDEQTHTYECMLCHNDKGTSDHRWNNGVTSIKGACDENGTITYTCIDCSATKTENYVPTSAHTFGAWMRQDGERHKHTCMVCEKSESADHRWNNGVPSIKGTCDEAGKVSYTCTDCGATKTEAYVPTSPHTFGEWSRQNDEMHRHTCTACGKSERADHRWDEGFSSIGGICDENGTTTYTCIDCGMIRIVYYQPQAPHSYEMWERVDDQSHCRVCSTCGREETRAHDWIGGEIHASAACDENGYRLYSCVACGISRQEPINPTSHSFGEWSYNATLHLMERVCLCGKKETQAGATTPPISAGGVQILPGQDLFLPVGTELIAEKLSDSAEDAVYETVMEQLAYLNQGATPFAAYDIYLMANGASVSAGNEITISIPTSAAEIERFESVSVYYLSDGGRLYACPTTVEDGAVHFTTLSNGRFLIVGKEAEPNRAWIWILVVGLVVLGGAVVAVLLLLKKKNTQATSSGSYQAKNSADVKSAGDATVSGQEKPRT